MEQLKNNQTLMLNPSDIYTCQNIVFDVVIRKIKQGIQLGDSIPSISVADLSYLGQEFNGKFAISEGNHSAFACLKLGKLVQAEPNSKFRPKACWLQRVDELHLDYNDELAKKHMKGRFYRTGEGI